MGGKTMPLSQVAYVSRREAESRVGSAEWAIISISDPFHYPAMLKGGWHSVLRLEFSDILQESKMSVLFSEIDAQSIRKFVKHADENGCAGILVHCKAGVSRSASIAKWVAEKFGLSVDSSFDGYNRHVYLMLKATSDIPTSDSASCGG
jgi:predicted protein tyrosine phosphatase